MLLYNLMVFKNLKITSFCSRSVSIQPFCRSFTVALCAHAHLSCSPAVPSPFQRPQDSIVSWLRALQQNEYNVLQ